VRRYLGLVLLQYDFVIDAFGVDVLVYAALCELSPPRLLPKFRRISNPTLPPRVGPKHL